MRFEKPCCPHCGELAQGTVDTVPAIALLVHEANGQAEYYGSSDMLWDDQKSDWNKDGTLLICHQGHTWRSQDLVDCVRKEFRRIVADFLTGDSGWKIAACTMNEENSDLFCCHCNEQIPSAWGEQ